jgi:hypothetical protein
MFNITLLIILADPKFHLILCLYSQIGYKAWQALSQLESQWDVLSNRTEICTPLVTSNGFKIVVNKSEGEYCI